MKRRGEVLKTAHTSSCEAGEGRPLRRGRPLTWHGFSASDAWWGTCFECPKFAQVKTMSGDVLCNRCWSSKQREASDDREGV